MCAYNVDCFVVFSFVFFHLKTLSPGFSEELSTMLCSKVNLISTALTEMNLSDCFDLLLPYLCELFSNSATVVMVCFNHTTPYYPLLPFTTPYYPYYPYYPSLPLHYPFTTPLLPLHYPSLPPITPLLTLLLPYYLLLPLLPHHYPSLPLIIPLLPPHYPLLPLY